MVESHQATHGKSGESPGASDSNGFPGYPGEAGRAGMDVGNLVLRFFSLPPSAVQSCTRWTKWWFLEEMAVMVMVDMVKREALGSQVYLAVSAEVPRRDDSDYEPAAVCWSASKLLWFLGKAVCLAHVNY